MSPNRLFILCNVQVYSYRQVCEVLRFDFIAIYFQMSLLSARRCHSCLLMSKQCAIDLRIALFSGCLFLPMRAKSAG